MQILISAAPNNSFVDLTLYKMSPGILKRSQTPGVAYTRWESVEDDDRATLEVMKSLKGLKLPLSKQVMMNHFCLFTL